MPASPAPVLLFGHGVPLEAPLLAGLPMGDVTRQRHAAPPGSRVAAMLEPFLDPFVRSFLLGLESGAFDQAAAIVVWRQGAGALHAYRYAAEFRRLGLLPPAPPLLLWNRAFGAGPAAEAFNRAEAARLAAALAGVARGAPIDRGAALAALEALQAEGRVGGAEAFARRLAAREGGGPVSLAPEAPRAGPRLALAGAPLGGPGLHRWLDARGVLVLDLQGPDAPAGDIGTLLAERRVERLVWQVDPHDDLHGWRMPRLRETCRAAGVAFTDLGFVPSWPEPGDLPEALA